MAVNKEDMRGRIRELRLTLKLSSKDFAEKVGIKQPNLTGIETGLRPLGEKMIYRIASAVQANPKWIITGEGPMMQGDIDASGNHGIIGNVGGAGNTAHMTVNAYGYQKIIHPDGLIELIPYQPGEQGHPMPIEQIINEYNTLQLERASWERERKHLNSLLDNYQKLLDKLPK